MESHEAMERFERAEGLAEQREHFARHAAILVAIIAALLAIAAITVERAGEQVLLAQAQSSDAYNELEANSLKKHTDGDTAQVLRMLAANNPAAIAVADKLQKAVDTKYSPNEAALLTKAEGLARDREAAEKHHTLLQLAEAGFQLAIVLTSIAIVARVRAFLYAGGALALIGVLMLIGGLTLVVKFI